MKESKDKFELEMYRTFMYGFLKSLEELSKDESKDLTMKAYFLGIKLAANNLKERLDTIKQITK